MDRGQGKARRQWLHEPRRPLFPYIQHASIFLLHGLAESGRAADKSFRGGRRRFRSELDD